MPKKVLPDASGFAKLEELLVSWGFRAISPSEVQKDFKRLDLKAPSPREGREAGFSFSAHGLVVSVWTTWLQEEGRARESDAGWVLISEGDKNLYFAHPVHRTKHFIRNLARQAWIAKRRVQDRPLCPDEGCKQFMDIVSGTALKSRYWRCGRKKLHADGKITRRNWDCALPPKAAKYVEAKRKQRDKNRKRREKRQEREPFPAVLKRRPWRKRISTD